MFQFSDVKIILFDFDGVWTDNKVITDTNGIEYITTSRCDSWGLNIFKKFIKDNFLEMDIFVVTTETNNVVKQRCKKLNLHCYSGVKDKLKVLKNLASERGFQLNSNMKYDQIIFLGNDLNDIEAMQVCEYCACPKDSYNEVLEISKFIGKNKGGDGFVREFFDYFIANFKL